MVRKQGSPKNSVHHRTRTPERNQRRETSTHPRWQRADDGGETVRGAREPTPSAAPLSLHGGGAYHFPTGVAGAAPTVGNEGSHRAWKQGTRVRKHSPGTARPTPQHPVHPRRRPRLGRPGLLRFHHYPHSQPRPAGRPRHPVHPRLCGITLVLLHQDQSVHGALPGTLASRPRRTARHPFPGKRHPGRPPHPFLTSR